MATTFIDIILPIVTFVVAALLTIPLFKAIRKNTYKTALSVAWVVVVFAVAALTVVNLVLSYYSISDPGIINLTLDGTLDVAIGTSFLIDAVSIYMAIIIVAISSVVVVYTVFFVDTCDHPTDRYIAIMLMLTGAIVGAVLAGDLLTFFIFWEAATALRISDMVG